MDIALGTCAYDMLFAQGNPLLSRQILIKFRSGVGAGQPHIMSGVWRNLGLNSFDEREIVPESVRHCQGVGRRANSIDEVRYKSSTAEFLKSHNAGEFRRVRDGGGGTPAVHSPRYLLREREPDRSKGGVHAWLRGCALSYRSSPVGVTA